MEWWEPLAKPYPRGAVILQHRSRYQEIKLERMADGHIQFSIDGQFQFFTDTLDAYHEMLAVLPTLTVPASPTSQQILVLGGGDGLCARAIVKHTDWHCVTCDIDAEIVNLFRTHNLLRALNENSYEHVRSRVVVCDARQYVQQPENRGAFDVIVGDYVSAEDDWHSADTCYSGGQIEAFKALMQPEGVLQMMLSARRGFQWRVVARALEYFKHVVLYDAEFNDDGSGEEFFIASDTPFALRKAIPSSCYFLNEQRARAVFDENPITAAELMRAAYLTDTELEPGDADFALLERLARAGK